MSEAGDLLDYVVARLGGCASGWDPTFAAPPRAKRYL